MKRVNQLLTLLVVVFCAASFSYAQITTPAIIGDNMVLKRNSKAKIWGWADNASENIYVVAEWNPTDTIRVKCSNYARFELEVDTPEAGGPYTIKIVGAKSRKEIQNVMIGEVWLCSGQSNMRMSTTVTYGTKIEYGDEMSTVNNPQIRTFLVPQKGADFPQEDCGGNWDQLSSQTVSDVSLTAYFYAQKLQKELGIPIGIVMSSWGGAHAELWMSEETQEECQAVKASASVFKPKSWMPNKLGSLYNGMIYPLVPFNFSGAIWYQGEGNIIAYQYYDQVMRTLIDSWRAKFDNDELPFYYVQIAPFSYNSNFTGLAAYLREEQAVTAKYENCGMIVVNDLVDNVKNIHPKNKKDVGYRLADLALNRTYGMSEYKCDYPEVESVSVNGKKVLVKINNMAGELLLVNGDNSGFKIAASDGEFVAATAKIIDSKTIELTSKEVKEPKYVRYLFDDASVCGVKNSDGLPLAPYRNDDLQGVTDVKN